MSTLSNSKVGMLSDLMEFHASVKDNVLSGSFLDRIAKWICENTYVKGTNWGFVDHEFQLDIVNDKRPESACQKCAQMGLTELEIRRALGFTVLNTGGTVIYTLPTRTFALKFAKGRIDPVIATSKTLRTSMVTGADGSEFKQIGNGFMYIGGAQNVSQSISVPADYLVHDEVDFSNPNALAAYGSRIRHSDHKIRRHFSTPTVSGYGINLMMEDTSQARYVVKCGKCTTELMPDFFEDVRIPGFDQSFDKFTKADLHVDRYKWREAYIICKRCKNPIDKYLADKSRRRWVHMFPSKDKAGWFVRPFDLMKYNSTASIIGQISQYKRYQDYVNNVHGLTYKSQENEIDIGTVIQNTVIDEEDYGEGCYMGIDVGKKIRIMIAKPSGEKFDVIKAMTIRGSEFSHETIAELFFRYGCIRMVIDSQPDWTLCQHVVAKIGDTCHPCVYVEENKRKPEHFTINKDTNIVNAVRTTCLDGFVQDVNKSKVQFPKCDEMEDVRKHFTGMKRTEEYGDDGELVPRWTKISDEDHYFHAGLYCWLAWKIEEPEVVPYVEVCPTNIMGASMYSGEAYKPSLLDNEMSIREALTFMGVTKIGG